MNSSKLCFVVLIVLICQGAAAENWLKDLLDPHISHWNPLKSGSDALEVEYVGLDTLDGFIAAYGDFNSDKYVDVFTLRTAENVDIMEIYIWQGDNNNPSDQFQQLDAQLTAPQIDCVIPSDYNYDGRLDVLIQGLDENGQPFALVAFSDGAQFYANFTFTEVPSTVQLLLLDANMDMRVDLFGALNSTQQRTFWINQGDGSFVAQEAFPSGENLLPIAEPHSNAFADINGDCLADLVVISTNGTTKFLEVWVSNFDDETGFTGFTLDLTLEFPPGAGQLTFSDIDHEGTIDFVFPVCYPSNDCSITNAIYVVYNAQEAMCTSITGGGDDCRDSSDVCGEPTEYSLPDLTGPANQDLVIIQNATFGGQVLYFTYSPIYPNTLAVGDYNLDSFPDLLVLLTNGRNSQVQVWNSVACDTSSCTSDAVDAGRRTFARTTDGTSAVENITNPFAATFFDTNDDGTLDIYVFSDSSITNPNVTATKAVTSVENTMENDGFFLKSTSTNGVCVQWCFDEESKFPYPKPTGVNLPGAMFKYIWTDNSQDKRVAMGGQLMQSAYLALQTPYVYLGLGDTSNYLQYIHLGVPSSLGRTFTKSWPDVLPNSQVAMIPYPPDKPYFWKVEVYMRPSGVTFYAFLVCVITCLVLGISAIFFRWREKKQDGREASTSLIL